MDQNASEREILNTHTPKKKKISHKTSNCIELDQNASERDEEGETECVCVRLSVSERVAKPKRMAEFSTWNGFYIYIKFGLVPTEIFLFEPFGTALFNI